MLFWYVDKIFQIMQTFLSASGRISHFFQFYLQMAVIEKLYLISEISYHSRGNTVLLPFKILPKLMSKCPNQMSMYLLQPALLNLDFGKSRVYLASCYHSFLYKVHYSLLTCIKILLQCHCHSYLVTVIYSVTVF